MLALGSINVTESNPQLDVIPRMRNASRAGVPHGHFGETLPEQPPNAGANNAVGQYSIGPT
jgi:hypothetical protein